FRHHPDASDPHHPTLRVIERRGRTGVYLGVYHSRIVGYSATRVASGSGFPGGDERVTGCGNDEHSAGYCPSGYPAVSESGRGQISMAEEYAMRLAAAYRGIFWLRALGNDDTREALSAVEQEALRQEQFRDVAVALGLPGLEQLKP